MSLETPTGIRVIVALCLLLALLSLTFAVLLFAAQLPLSSGSFLLGGGFEQRGPLAFLIYAILLFAVAIGLWRRSNLARRAAILLAVAGIFFAVPAISSAVVDQRLFAITREGAQIIARVLIVFYLTQEPVRDWFASRS